jgi:hypothetical protein
VVALAAAAKSCWTSSVDQSTLSNELQYQVSVPEPVMLRNKWGEAYPLLYQLWMDKARS